MQSEAVHPINSWAEMRQRMGDRRRVFVFTHRMLPDEPLVVLHALLGDGIPNNISSVLQTDNKLTDKELIKTATFYSISSIHRGNYWRCFSCKYILFHVHQITIC